MSNIDTILTQHATLFERVNEEESLADVLDEIEDFTKVIKKAGSTATDTGQRNQLRSLLGYWGSILDDETGKYSNIELPPTIIQPDKVFISWSQGSSNQLAVLLSDWLPHMLKDIKTLRTSKEIKLGGNWINNLGRQLEISQLAIVCIGPDSLEDKNQIFELGTIAKTIDSERIFILLHNLEPSDLPSPVNHFYRLRTDRKGIWTLVRKLNNLIGSEPVPEEELEANFNIVWRSFEMGLEDIESKEVQEAKSILDVYQISDALLVQPEAAYLYEAKRFGVGNGSANFECKIGDDGTIRVKRTVEVEAFSEIATLDSFLLFSQSTQDEFADLNLVYVREASSSRIDTSKDSLNDTGFGVGDQHDSLSNQRITLGRSINAPDRLLVDLVFNPPLRPGERFRYEMGESGQDAFILGKNIANLSLTEVPYEEFGWAVVRPTRKLRLAVTFPRFETPKVYHKAVRRTSSTGFPTTPIQHSELKQVREPRLISYTDLTDHYTLVMEVDYPMLGLVYLFRWKPNYSGSAHP